MQLDFFVRRKGLDPTAETSLHALRDLMGEDVRAVEHGMLWRFEVESGADGAILKPAIARAASRAGRYVNLNRDETSWLDETETAHGPAGSWGVDLWIRDGSGEDEVARAYFQAQIRQDLRRLRRGPLYRLWLPLADAEAARRKAEQLATTRNRRQGLLMNPHAQSLEILGVRAGREGT
jgi:hypothetical protein